MGDGLTIGRPRLNLGTYPIEQTIDAQSIPEPASLALLASGALLCLAASKLKSS